MDGIEPVLAAAWTQPLVRLCHRLANTNDLNDMFQSVVQALVETTGFSRASVLTFDGAGVMRFRAWQGLSEHYRRKVDGHSPWRADERNARPQFIGDVRSVPALHELQPVFQSEGIEALAFLPLVGGGRLLGKFMLYSEHPVQWRGIDNGFALAAADLLTSFLLREEASEKLLHARRMESLGLMAGGIAHDFNNLLTTILGYVALIREETVRGTPARGYVEVLLHTTERAAELTKQLLGFARPDTRAHEVVDLAEFVAEVRPSFERMCGPERRLEVVAAAEPMLVLGSRVQLHQLLLNLVQNACDAMPAGGAVTIVLQAAADPDAVELTVSDTGIGMDEATRARVFDPLFTTKSNGRGTGLGLATCYAIVAGMGGEISVRSAPGHGASFVMRVPRARTPAPRPTSVAPDKPVARVLLVEDQDDVRSMLVRALRTMGFAVANAVNGRAAMSMLAEQSFDVVVSDVVMPEIGGIDLAHMVMERWPDVHMLLVTGFVDAPEGVPEGVPVLHKPFLPRELGHRIRMLTAK